MADLVIREDPISAATIRGYAAAVQALADELAVEHDVRVIRRPPQTQRAVAVAAIETFAVWFGGGFAGAAGAAAYQAAARQVGTVMTRFVRRRHPERVAEQCDDRRIVTEFKLFGPDGSLLRSWSSLTDDRDDDDD